jgi:hypothetical protein
MPNAPARPCRQPRCPQLTRLPHGFCVEHAGSAVSTRPISRNQSKLHAANYGGWRRIRAEVLSAAGIPSSQHNLYSVDHRPAYDPAREPDHRRYALVPMLIPQHNSKTAREDSGFGNPRRSSA